MSLLDENLETKVDLQIALEELQKVKYELICHITNREMEYMTHINELTDRIEHLENEVGLLRYNLNELKARYENLTINKFYKLDGSIEDISLVK